MIRRIIIGLITVLLLALMVSCSDQSNAGLHSIGRWIVSQSTITHKCYDTYISDIGQSNAIVALGAEVPCDGLTH